MPLLVSPIDGKTPMQQIIRNGVEFDRCPVSGGIWLDAGELEKLLSAAQAALQQDRESYADYRQSAPHYRPAAPPASYQGKPYKYDDDYEKYHQSKHGKKSAMRSFFELFD